MDAREQLLQSLTRDLDSFQLPERFSQAQKDQIMKGRKGQADIDAGRRAIEANEEQYQRALTQRGTLQKQIQDLSGEVGAAKERAAAESPYEQGRQIALFGLPAAAGLVGGYAKGSSLSDMLRARAAERSSRIGELAESVRTREIPHAEAAKTARSLRLAGPSRHGLGPLGAGLALTGIGAGQRALAPNLTENPVGQDVLRALGGLESGIGMGLTAQQIGSLAGGVTQPSARDVATIASGPPPAPEPPTPAAKPAPNPGTRADLLQQAKARGLEVTTRTKKAELESKLAAAMKRASRAAKKSSKAILPAAAGLSVYDALRSPAEAEDGTVSEPMSRPAAAAAGAGAAGATGGAIAGGRSLASRLASGPLGSALRVAGRAAVPVGIGMTAYDVGRGINALAHLSPPQDPGEYSTMGAFMPPEAAQEPPAPVEAPPPDDAGDLSEFDQLVTASQQDPELAAMLRDAILARVQQANEQQVPNALASQAVASRGGDPMANALRSFAQR